MPLVRYEIRNEHSLANPQLYRTAAKDDPEGLLEGVAMAGLVGIVRQLGDLAEFAAEVFRDLHEEVMATASRGHELLARVQQLEAEMPAVEKALLSETNQLRFAYTPGAEWHASIRNDQNHCTQGDLPRFIRNSYEECRGPPRLFLLDKFDVAGAGACLKRYTDPSFFRTEWASSELMKAERVQRDKKARREKKKGRRRRNVDGKESIPVDQYHTRFSHELKEHPQPDQVHPRMWHQPVSERSEAASAAVENMNYNENLNAISRHLAEAQGLSQDVARTNNFTPGDVQDALLQDFVDVPMPAVSEVPATPQDMEQKSVSAANIDSKEMLREQDESGSNAAYKDKTVLNAQQAAATDVGDDGASEGEQFLDALTTMESEVDTDSEPGFRQDRDADTNRVFDANEGLSTLREGLRSPGPSQTSENEKMTVSMEQSQAASEEDLRVPGLNQAPTEKILTPSVDQPPTLVQDNLRSPAFDETTATENMTVSVERSSASRLLGSSGQDSSHEATGIVNGQDANGISSSTTAGHVRRHSTDSVSSSSSRRPKRLQSLDEPWEKFSVQQKHFTPTRDDRGATKPFEPGTVSSGAGVKVSKMVAAFERGSLDQIHDKEPEKEPEKEPGKEPEKEPEVTSRESTTLHSLGESVNQASEDVDNDDTPEDHISDSNSLPDSRSPFLASPASSSSISTKVSSTKCHTSLSPPRIRVPGTSPSHYLSPGSLDSPPDSPIFSALHSPMSPIRATRNILSSPDSHSRGFSAEPLSPVSPTSVPILALSPTSQRVPRPFTSLDQGNHHTLEGLNSSMLEVPFNLASPTSSPAESPSTLETEELPETVPPSPTILSVTRDSAIPHLMAEEDFNDHVSPLPAGSLDHLPPSSPPKVSSDYVSPVRESLDYSEEFNATANNLPDVTHTSNAEHELRTSPRVERVENSGRAMLSPSRPQIEDYVTSSMLDDDAPEHAPSKAGLEPILSPSSPLPSESVHDFTPQNFSIGNHDKPPLSLSSRSVDKASKVSYSEKSQDLPFSNHKAAHKRSPSLPPSDKTPDFSSASSLKSSQEPPSGTSSNPATDAQVPASKSVHDVPSPSPLSRTVDDLPFSVPKSSHKRFPSFPSTEKAMLEFVSSSFSKPLQDPPTSSVRLSKPAAVPKFKLVHTQSPPSVPFQTLNALPPSTPSKSERDSVHSANPPLRTLHELPPPPPPLRTPPPVSVAKPSVGVDVQDALLEAIASHDKSTLKKVKTMQNPSLRKGDGRSHLLEQIRAQSFNLRHTVVEKVDPPLPRPMTNINVAVILEKANAIRQAFAGSDEDDDDDDDWSDV